METTAVLQSDIDAARDALVKGAETCPRLKYLQTGKVEDCDCPQGQIGACETTLFQVAAIIAEARGG